MSAPAFECGRNVIEHFPVEFATAVPFQPNFALNSFQSRGLAILVHQPVNITGGTVGPIRRIVSRAYVVVIFMPEVSQVCVAHIVGDMLACIREENVVDECNWRRGAFDIEENSPHYATKVRPKQTGSNFSSTQ